MRAKIKGKELLKKFQHDTVLHQIKVLCIVKKFVNRRLA